LIIYDTIIYMKLTFNGGVGEVTGANYLLESGTKKILIDCGLHQGSHFSDQLNWESFPYNPAEIDAVVITHTHIDHTGLLPKLVRDGFKGRVISTEPTKDFAKILLMDSEHILLQEAERHKKEPLYTLRDIEDLMAKWEGYRYHEEVEIGPFRVTLFNAGHILGSSIILIEVEGKKIIFSGDLGNTPSPIIGATEFLGDDIDYCLIESTYGNRIHEGPHQKGVVEDVIEETVKRGGTLLIPAFAMERTQKLLFEINELIENGRIPQIPIFLDSPLAIKVTDVYKKHTDYFDEETIKYLKKDHTLFSFPGLKQTITTDESKSINDIQPPKVIIAGSGMSQGGRILHHEKRYLSDSKNTILFVGYQAKNSLGRKIQDGEKVVTIHKEKIPVKCKIVSAGNYSAHADQNQLLDWLYPMRYGLEKVFVVQGDPEESEALRNKIVNDLVVRAEIPEKGKTYEL